MSADLEARPWIRAGLGTRCTRHQTQFVLPETCPSCATDPGPPVNDEIDAPPLAPPRGCKGQNELERWFTAIALAADKSAKRVEKKKRKSFHDEGSIAKHRDNAIKAMRAAGELALRREDTALVNAREKRIRDRAKGTSH